MRYASPLQLSLEPLCSFIPDRLPSVCALALNADDYNAHAQLQQQMSQQQMPQQQLQQHQMAQQMPQQQQQQQQQFGYGAPRGQVSPMSPYGGGGGGGQGFPIAQASFGACAVLCWVAELCRVVPHLRVLLQCFVPSHACPPPPPLFPVYTGAYGAQYVGPGPPIQKGKVAS